MTRHSRKPTMVDLADLGADGGLLSSVDIYRAKQHAEQLMLLEQKGLAHAVLGADNTENTSQFRLNRVDKPISKISRKHPLPFAPLKFSFIEADNGETFALYKGKDKTLGEGGFGRVKIAQNVKSKEWYAVKVLQDGASPEDDTNHEFNMMSKLGLVVGQAVVPGAHEAKKYIFMQLARGLDFNQFLSAGIYNKIRLNQKLSFLIAAAHEIAELHAQGVVHRDIKPDNIMVDPKTNTAKLIDFGASAFIGQVDAPIMATLTHLCPEDRGYYTNATPARDNFAFGISMGEALADRYREDAANYVADNPREVDAITYRDGLLEIMQKEQKLRDELQDAHPLEFNELIKLVGQLTAADPAERLDAKSAAHALDHIKCLLDTWDNVLECYGRVAEGLDQASDLHNLSDKLEKFSEELQTVLETDTLAKKAMALFNLLPQAQSLCKTAHLEYGLEKRLSENLAHLNRHLQIPSSHQPQFDNTTRKNTLLMSRPASDSLDQAELVKRPKL